MNDNPYIPFYTSDFLGGTSGMSAATKGVYITLLCLMYESEGPLTQKEDVLARRCGSTPRWFKAAIDDLKHDGKLIEKDGGLWSPTCDKHIEKRRAVKTANANNARMRWEKEQQKQQMSDATAMQSECQPEPEPYSNTLEDKSSNEGKAFDASEAAIWKRGVPFLVERGVPDQKARQMIGKWIRDHGSPALFSALTEAAKSGTGDPIPYVTKILTQPARPSVADMVRAAGEKIHA